MKLLRFFRPVPYKEEIQDPEIIKKNYSYWRIRTFLGMYVGYAFFYFTRKSFNYAMPALQADLGLGKLEIGILGSTLSIAYGASKFLSGILGDKSNPRYFMSIGLILTGVFNFCFGMSSALWALALFWGLNGWFQGWGWPGCAKLLTHWYSQSERGRWWGIWNTSHNLGGALPLLGAYVAQYMGWRYAMYLPGIVCILVGFYIMSRLRDTPQSLGLPPIEKFRNDYGNSSREKEKSELSTKDILVKYVLRNKYIWVLAFAYFFVYIIRTALDWSILYLVEVKGYSNFKAGACYFLFEIGGAFGGITAGWTSDLIFRGKRNPVNVLFSLAIVFLILGYQAFTQANPLIDGAFLFLFGFFIFGPQMLIGMATAELSHKKAAATATGFAGFFAYCLGAACAGAPLGLVIKHAGWNAFYMTLMGCALCAALLLIPLWSIKTYPKEKLPVEPQPAPEA
ncbi:MAG TPA: MFS transporter [Chlamydiales bacterium]|jgi:OPA family sugar phosphate sensor protein UhpC-like MFS transporter